MAAHTTATAVAVLCAAISGGTLLLILEHLQRIPKSALWRGHIGGTLVVRKYVNNQKLKINTLSTLSFQLHDPKTKEVQAKIAKPEKVSCGRVLTWARVASAPRSLKLLPRKITSGKFNNHIVLSSMNIVLQLSEIRLRTPLRPPPPPLEVRVTALCGQYWGVPLDRISFFGLCP